MFQCALKMIMNTHLQNPFGIVKTVIVLYVSILYRMMIVVGGLLLACFPPLYGVSWKDYEFYSVQKMMRTMFGQLNTNCEFLKFTVNCNIYD